MILEGVQKAFSASAYRYDNLTKLHQNIGYELIGRINYVNAGDVILDIGMGTGWVTERMASVFDKSEIVGVDFAEGMIEESRRKEARFKLVQADADALPFADESFDLIVSNCAYQWVKDLEKGFLDCERMLKPHGRIIMSIFGYETFNELFASLNMTKKETEISIQRLPKKSAISEAIESTSLDVVKIASEMRLQEFENMMALLRWIKEIGGNHLQRNFFIGRDWLKRAQNYYQQIFSNDNRNVYSSFEVIWVEVCKRG